jgi:hypothetical protein
METGKVPPQHSGMDFESVHYRMTGAARSTPSATCADDCISAPSAVTREQSLAPY